jgi:hypothetical protein
MPLEQGQRVGDYEVLSLLGAGGMGRVYRVRNIISDRVEAMKILLPDYASEPDLAARFMAEIRTLAALDHPNIAQLRTAFQFENQLVMVMEFVEGATLDTVARQTPAALDQIIEYGTQVLSALSYAHSHGVTHRDIKPANIMITSHGLAKLMDFGIAKSAGDLQLTRPGTTMGSVYYMSPEQVRGGTVDPRSDIYSFGVTLYEMLTGRKPFQADTSFSVLNAQLNEAPTPPIEVNPALPQALNEIILKAMAKAPSDRFQSADAMRNALRAVQQQPSAAGYAPSATAAFAGSSAPAAPDPAWKPVPVAAALSPMRKNHRGLWIALGAAAALIALIAVAALLPHVLSARAGQKAEQASALTPSSPATQPAPAPSPAGDQGATPAPVPAEQPQPTAATPPPAAHAQRAPYTPATHAHAQPDVPRTESGPAAAPQSAPAAAQPAVPAGPSPKEMQDAHDRLSNLGARADAARSGVNSIRRQQQAQGLDLRGDILAATSRLNNDMNGADQALNRNDPSTANEYMDRAERELGTLESFLGQ